MKGVAIILMFLVAALAAVSCTPGATQEQSKAQQAKIRIANVKLNKEAQAMVIITGEAWNDDNVPAKAVITGTLYDANGKVLVSGDQTLPVIPPSKGVPFNIPFPPNQQAVKQSVVVKSVEKVENK